MQAIVRAGVTAEVSIVYQMEPQATARVCAVSCQASSQICIRAYESWPGNSIDLYAWYQTLRVRWCGGWVSTHLSLLVPCIILNAITKSIDQLPMWIKVGESTSLECF